MFTINIWAIVIATIVSFLISAVWYSSFLFGNDWLTLVKISENEVNTMRAAGMWRSYSIHLLSTLITLFVLAFAMSMIGIHNATDGAFIGFFAWLGFIAPSGVLDYLWRKTPMRLILIDSVCVLLSLVISGAILAAW